MLRQLGEVLQYWPKHLPHRSEAGSRDKQSLELSPSVVSCIKHGWEARLKHFSLWASLLSGTQLPAEKLEHQFEFHLPRRTAGRSPLGSRGTCGSIVDITGEVAGRARMRWVQHAARQSSKVLPPLSLHHLQSCGAGAKHKETSQPSNKIAFFELTESGRGHREHRWQKLSVMLGQARWGSGKKLCSCCGWWVWRV